MNVELAVILVFLFCIVFAIFIGRYIWHCLKNDDSPSFPDAIKEMFK